MTTSETIRVVVVGARGRMGREAARAVQEAPDLELVGEIEVEDDLRVELARHRPDVAVDFTSPEAVEPNLVTYLESSVRPVVGTTGLSDAALARCQELARARGVGGLVAPNFAVGAVLMMELARIAARHLKSVEIIEYHHPGKLDAPSGTSLLTRRRIQESGGLDDVPIHSVRLSGFLAHQEVIFGSLGERLTIRHDSIDRLCFMPGVLLGIRRVTEIDELVVGLESFLK